MCDEERREGKEELYLTSSRVDLTGDEEKKRGEEKEQEKKRREEKRREKNLGSLEGPHTVTGTGTG